MEKKIISSTDQDFRTFAILVAAYDNLRKIAEMYETPENGTPDPVKTNVCGSAAHAARVLGHGLNCLGEALFPPFPNDKPVENV